jgi:hypothetical protein
MSQAMPKENPKDHDYEHLAKSIIANSFDAAAAMRSLEHPSSSCRVVWGRPTTITLRD